MKSQKSTRTERLIESQIGPSGNITRRYDF